MKKAGMILEGGGQRGIFTSGVLDYLMEKKVELPYVIGVSAGACNAVDYVCWQGEIPHAAPAYPPDQGVYAGCTARQ